MVESATLGEVFVTPSTINHLFLLLGYACDLNCCTRLNSPRH